MTTITREQQKQILIDTANHVISRDNTSPYSENLRELARIALASLEAEPVAWECGENIILFNPDTVEAYAKRAEISPKPLYDSPVVPDAISTRQAISKMEECEPCDSINVAYKYGWNACRAAMLQGVEQPQNARQNIPENIPDGNSQVIPDDWVMVPKKLTAENGAKSLLSGEFLETTFISCPECLADEECESCDGSGRIKIEVPVSWTTIKAIWNKGVEHFRSSTATGDN
ncbi:hypothetical protein NAZ31_003303 [Salmonella enterica]|nr:hypothetical protein [Salmonella enterica]EHS0167396.1 hypothetical protein [Salmonella enterica]EHT9149104.1 hypothetical protein [Salmonella enterica]EIK1958606.1 hypothetical protein [Salmonella enterica]EJG9006020.1 hypothetical protein [Salmonella enterica]